MSTVTVTGHRPNKLWNDYDLLKVPTLAIGKEMDRILLELQCKCAITGGALGIDMLFAIRALGLGIPLTVALPFKGYDAWWPERSQLAWSRIISQASNVVYVNELNMAYMGGKSYISRLLMERNIWMVNQLTDPADRLLAVWDGSPGGTKNCYQYGVKTLGADRVIRLNPKDFGNQPKLF